ncbi:hypothetical protein [Vibrio sp. 10N.261.51.F12]|uniref:hypothetical protein n=1 Tax=Vibrio sp. 10N.261.51.F12 TaxID=3229679 RepID=UPI00354F9534
MESWISGIGAGLLAGAEFGIFLAVIYTVMNWSERDKWRTFFLLWGAITIGVGIGATIISGIYIAFKAM